jgi:type I restriction enzyme S subunit
MVGVTMAMNQSCYAVVGRAGWPASFIYFLLKTTAQTLQERTHGSVFDTITRQTFDAVSGLHPTPEMAEAFERYVATFMERIKANLHENETLAQTRDVLLSKLMSGEIRLRDAEKIAGEAL